MSFIDEKKKYCVTVFDATCMCFYDFFLNGEEIKQPFTYPRYVEPFEEFNQHIKSFIPLDVFKKRHGLFRKIIHTIYCSPEQDKFLKDYYSTFYTKDGIGQLIKDSKVVFGNHYTESQIDDIYTCLKLKTKMDDNERKHSL